LQDVHVIRPHLHRGISDIPHDVLTIPIVWRFVVVTRELHGAAAFGRHIEFTAPLRQILTDVHLAFAVVIGGINEVNAGIKHRVQNGFGLLITARPPTPDAITANFHRAEAKLRHFQTGTSQCSLE